MDSLRLAALEASQGLAPTPSNIERVAAKTSVEAARWAFEQSALRLRAQERFLSAEVMFWTRQGLEQATHPAIAAWHASRFPPGQLVIDTCCGVGIDCIALARRGPTIGYELDPETAECARLNLLSANLEPDIRIEDGVEAANSARFAFADPSRRVEGRRTLEPSHFSPDPANVAKAFAGLELGLMKLSPMLPDAYLEELSSSRTFVSFGRECRECLLEFGVRAIQGVRAIRIETGSDLQERTSPIRTDSPQDWIHEADPAAIRAHALGSIDPQLQSLGDSNGYLTGQHPCESEWLRSYKVLGEPTGDLRILEAGLKRLSAGNVIVKSRVPGLKVDDLRRRFKLKGDREVVVIAYPIGPKVRYVTTVSVQAP